MRAEVVCVGTELLLGDIVNSNAATIGRMLANAGVECYRHVVVGDNEERIASALERALQDADAVVVSGGLGPTQDDITREAVCRVTGQSMVFDERMAAAIRDRFARLRRHMPEINLRQAERPERALPIEPLIGTAPGLIVPHGDKVLYLVPGVPSEMEEMMERAVIPDLTERAGTPGIIVSRLVRVVGLAESAIAETLRDAWESFESGDVRMAFLAGGGEVRIRLTTLASDPDAAAAVLDSAEKSVRARLGPAVVGVDDQTLEAVVLSLLTDRDWTIACAESLTGGMLSSRLTEAPGSSKRFLGGVVSYTEDVKALALGVPREVLESCGAVSKECALAMASGVRSRLSASVGVSTTGVAGPEDPEGKGVGTVFVAVSGPNGDAYREVHLPGGRTTIRQMSATAALNLARLYLQEDLP